MRCLDGLVDSLLTNTRERGSEEQNYTLSGWVMGNDVTHVCNRVESALVAFGQRLFLEAPSQFPVLVS